MGATSRRSGALAAESPGMVVTVLFAAFVGVLLSVAVVGWAARRLGLPIDETLAWFGLTEHPGLNDGRQLS